MPLSRYRLLALDIDGTLVNSRDEVTAPTLAALKQAQAAGIRLVLVTGRRYRRVLPLVEQLGLDAPVVTASGALIKHPATHHTLHRATLERELLIQLLRIIHDSGYDPVIYADSYHEGFDFYCRRTDVEHAELAEYLRLNAGFARVQSTLVTDPPDGVFAGFAIGSRSEMLALSAELERQLPGRLYTHVIRSPLYTGHMCEISRHGSTKWTGIRRLADLWGIADHEICAVGDDVNDLPMIEAAGLGIAMGNAVAEVKAAARRIAPGHDQDGLVEVVRWLLEGR